MKRIKGNKKMNNKGFTLVEILIAMSVLVIVSIPMLDTLSGATVVTRKASTRQRATLLGQSITEGVKRYSTLDLCKHFVESPDVLNFPILNGDNYTFEGFSRLERSGGGYTISTDVKENAKEYIFGIYGIEEGIEKYDALITLNPNDYEDLNAEVIPEIVNIGSPGTGLIDITGLYNGMDIIQEVKDRVALAGETFNPNNCRANVTVDIKKRYAPEVSYEIFSNITYTYTLSSGSMIHVDKNYVGSRTMDSKQRLHYVYVLLSDDNIRGTNNLVFNMDVIENGSAGEAENIPIALVTGNSSAKWNMSVVEGAYDASGVFVETYNWKNSVMFLTNGEDGSKINFRDALNDYGTSGNKLKRIYGLKVAMYPAKTNMADRFRGTPIDTITSSYLRIDVNDFNDEASKSE
ncbi:MAG: prepilin-type N-terminal cleavage/methylation domain-containing protein [Lachnospiraceae bacterium]|nr:prepilin-type N-terminal cleavage/methylation domain-containing protein [Lachnospiraceae bacterium]